MLCFQLSVHPTFNSYNKSGLSKHFGITFAYTFFCPLANNVGVCSVVWCLQGDLQNGGLRVKKPALSERHRCQDPIQKQHHLVAVGYNN